MALRRCVSRTMGACRGASLWPEVQTSTGCFMTQSELLISVLHPCQAHHQNAQAQLSHTTASTQLHAGWATGANTSDDVHQSPALYRVHEASQHFRSYRTVVGHPVSSERDESRPMLQSQAQPLRQCTTAATTPSVPDAEWNLEYSGVVSSTVRTLKMVSIATATLSLVGSPLYIMATMDGQYTAVKIMAASGFTCFGLFTTGLLHWFVGPYVHKLWFHEPSQQVKVQLLSIFAQPRMMVFGISEVEHPEGIAPLQTFQAKGRIMFIDEATFENKELLEKLTPPSPFDMDPDGSQEKKEGEQ